MKLKGAAFAWIFGLLMVALVVAVFAVGVVQHYNAQTTIVSDAVEAYDTVHVAEFTKRTLDGAAFAAAKSVPADLARGGGGFAEWTNETPTTEALAGKLEGALEQEMDLVAFNGLSRREIVWGTANITITKYDDTGFTFSGNKTFIVKSEVSTPRMTIWNQGAFAGTVTSSYFKLLRIGKAAAVCPAKEGDTTQLGLEQNITALADNTYSVDILDRAGGLELKYTLDCTGAVAS
jgi:hypothetical protein